MSAPAVIIVCLASWYASTGGRTAYDLPYTGRAMTCAADEWPKGTVLMLEAAKYPYAMGKKIIVTVTDKLGPEARELGRKIDLSPKAFKKLAPLDVGVITVRVVGSDIP